MWHPSSWKNCELEQQAEYPDKQALDTVIAELSQLPPLVSPQEVIRLRQLTADAAEGKLFLLQGGDCAESFEDCNPQSISRKLQLMQQMSMVFMHGLKKPVVRVGRMAGQYAKPRSTHTETQQGQSLPSYRGDLINHSLFDPDARQPDPARLLKGYSLASLTLNYVRTVNTEQLASLYDAASWNAHDLLGGEVSEPLLSTINEVQRSFALFANLTSAPLPTINEFFTCHEALHLDYEQALTRQVYDRWFNLSTHLPWLGMRTAKPSSAHIEYLRGIENPIGIKVGPRMSKDWLSTICHKLNPDNVAGKVTLITRLGHQQIGQLLPPLIEAVEKEKLKVTWCCDPMHGNTQITESGIKTRHLDHITSELEQAIEIHHSRSSVLGGVHLELTGESVTECVGGHCSIGHADLHKDYRSLVDPRLNRSQALELAARSLKSFKLQSVGDKKPAKKINL